jgi:hypothetical protein
MVITSVPWDSGILSVMTYPEVLCLAEHDGSTTTGTYGAGAVAEVYLPELFTPVVTATVYPLMI